MNSLLKVFLGVAIVILFAMLIYNAIEIKQQAEQKQGLQQEVFSELSSKGKIDNISNSIFGWLAKEILSIGNKTTKAKKNLDKKVLEIKNTQSKIIFLSLDFALAASLLLVLAFWLRQKLDDLAIGMLFISTVCLWLGLIIPILTIESSQVLPILGKTIFQYESRGIIDSIKTLFANGNPFLAYLLLAFSVVLPFAKTISLIVISLMRNSDYAKKISTVFSHIGKWSMTDVFVVAILVVFFASNNNSSTTSQIETGLYFFIFYVLLSLLASVVINTQVSKLNFSIQKQAKTEK